MIGEDAAAGHFVFFAQGHHVGQLDLALRGLLVDLDHDRQLDQAGRGHDLVGIEKNVSPLWRFLTAMATLPLWALASGARRFSRPLSSPGQGENSESRRTTGISFVFI